jgi:hypothetical protein
MITRRADLADAAAPPASTAEFPLATVIERIPLPGGTTLELAALAREVTPEDDAAAVDADMADLAARAAAWVAAGATDAVEPPVTIPLYGTLLVWSLRRAAVVGPPDRLPQMQAAVMEFAAHDADLRDAERLIAESMPHVDSDARFAFAFDEAALPHRGELADRFRQAVSIRRRLALLAPAVDRPAPQPPTFAGQLGERLRDRTRIVERLEFAVDQADLLERVYSACGDRASDFVVARRHLTLEWVIIILLAAEVLLVAVDLLGARAT